MSRLNVLVIHRMGPPQNRREAVIRLENMISEVRGDLNVFEQDADLPVSRSVRSVPFDLVVLGPTFLSSRGVRRVLDRAIGDYRDIVAAAAYRVALPQDDYDSTALLEEWLMEWRADVVYTVLPSRKAMLYPRLQHLTEIRTGFTGYITGTWIDQWAEPRPRLQRRVDVSYRTHDFGALRCDLRHLKFAIGERFREAVSGRAELELDISNRTEDHIPGVRWHDFLEGSKFCLATPSGSSFMDPYGDIRRCVTGFVSSHPSAGIGEVRAHCFPMDTTQAPFSAIAPRHLEAGLARTVQIATRGDYSGLMEAGEHYIPLDEDCGNIDEVVDQMKDRAHCERVADAFKERILAEPRLRRDFVVDEIVRSAEDAVSHRRSSRPTQDEVERLKREHERHVAAVGPRVWRRRALRSRAARLLDAHGGRAANWIRRVYR